MQPHLTGGPNPTCWAICPDSRTRPPLPRMAPVGPAPRNASEPWHQGRRAPMRCYTIHRP
ncbi:hypothetical protein WP39_12615 [Streptomyces sp. 604F]|nr:hypothetical protein [Streptomyces sp. 604F]